jgi:hypothetical protein
MRQSHDPRIKRDIRRDARITRAIEELHFSIFAIEEEDAPDRSRSLHPFTPHR